MECNIGKIEMHTVLLWGCHSMELLGLGVRWDPDVVPILSKWGPLHSYPQDRHPPPSE